MKLRMFLTRQYIICHKRDSSMASSLGWNHGTLLLAVCLVLVTMVTRSDSQYRKVKYPRYDCPYGYDYIGGFCYQFVKEKLSLSEAEAYCKERGGILAKPTSEVQQFEFWESYLNQKDIYDSVQMLDNDAEQDATLACQSKRYFVCERECSCVMKNGCPSGYDYVGGHCYAFDKLARLPHDQAQAKCKETGGMLAEPRARKDYQNLKHYLFITKGATKYSHIHVGGQKRDGSWIYESDNSKVPEPIDWAEDEPTRRQDEDCMMVETKGLRYDETQRPVWHDAACDTNTQYVCQTERPKDAECKVMVSWGGRDVAATLSTPSVCDSFKAYYVCEGIANRTMTEITRKDYCAHPQSIEQCGANCQLCDNFCKDRGIGAVHEHSNNCFFGDSLAYRGTRSTSVGGDECQKWTSRNPDNKYNSASLWPDKTVLDTNYCRDFSNDAYGLPWCYVWDGKTYFSSGIKYKRLTRERCFADPCSRKCFSGNSKAFKGDIRTTISHEQCQAWTSQWPHKHTTERDYFGGNFPESYRTRRGQCRDPSGKGIPWCYTDTNKWDFCFYNCSGDQAHSASVRIQQICAHVMFVVVALVACFLY